MTAISDHFSFTIRREGGIPVVAVNGELDVRSSPTLRRAVHDLVDMGQVAVVVDLSLTTFIDSSALQVFTSLDAEMREHGGMLGLRDPQRTVAKVLELVALDHMVLPT